MNVPHPRIVASIALDLARIEAGVSPAEGSDAIRAALETHGLAAFFQAAHARLAGSGFVSAAGPEPVAVAAAPPAGATLPASPGLTRQTWTDTIGSRICQPLRVFQPTSLDDLRSILRQAAVDGCRVKAVGSGHSFTDVAVTRDLLVDTHGLSRPLDLETDLLRAGSDPDTLFAAEAGIVVRDLNDALWAAGRGLVNMGGYDGQTIAGVISTSTHGSGLGFGPLSSQIVSLTVVGANGKTWRIEPTDGITDPIRWTARHPDVELKQDDAWFRAVQVGVGCLGVVYAVVLRVRGAYWLREERALGRWSRVKADLADGAVLRDNEHYEVLVNPYLTNGDHTCLITRRSEVPAPDEPPLAQPHRNFFVELVASIPGSSDLLLLVLNAYPDLIPQIIDAAMGSIVGDYVDRSYYVYNIGKANDVPAYGSEIGFPLDRYLDATDRILEIAAKRQRVGQAYLTSPFSLRFVKASDAYLSMMQGADTCMIEFPMLRGTVGGIELLQEIETEMYAFGGRPHWGLLNFLSGANDLIASMYPKLPDWLEIYRQIGGDGTFENAFTERCGFTPRRFGRG